MPYSSLINSFERKTDAPIEANYIFDTYTDLVSFYTSDPRPVTDPVSGLTVTVEFNEWRKNLHIGLLKVVKNNSDDSRLDTQNLGTQAVYWAIYNSLDANGFPDWKFDFVIGNDDIEYLKSKVTDLNTYIGSAVLKITEIEEVIAESLGATTFLQSRALLASLPTTFNNLSKISEFLHQFFETRDLVIDNSINGWLELKDFLSGYLDTDKLQNIISAIYTHIDSSIQTIYGEPYPSENYRSLRKIEDITRVDSCEQWHEINNLHTELNVTQSGVGLDGNGNYNPDQETKYLMHATSVMHALRILDKLIQKIFNECCSGGGGSVDLSNYYDKTEIDNLLSSVTVDLSNYYTKSEISNNYYNKTEIAGLIPSINLSNYYTKTEVEGLISTATADISGILTRLTAAEGYITDLRNKTREMEEVTSAALNDLNCRILAIDAALVTKVDEAPADGNEYVRKDGTWTIKT